MRRAPIASRLFLLATVPLLAVLLAMTQLVLAARSDGTAAVAESHRLHMMRAVSELQSSVVQPELLSAGLDPARSDLNGFKAALAQQFWSRFAERAETAAVGYESAVRRYPAALPAGADSAFRAEIVLVRQVLRDDPDDRSAQVRDALLGARARADQAEADLSLTFTTGYYLTYHGAVDIVRAAVSEAVTVLPTLAGVGKSTPAQISALSGARRNAALSVRLTGSAALNKGVSALINSQDYTVYEEAAERAVSIAAGHRRPDDVGTVVSVSATIEKLLNAVAQVRATEETTVLRHFTALKDGAERRAHRTLLEAALALLITFVLTGLVARTITRPLGDLTRRATELGEGRLDGRPIRISGNDELTRLGLALESEATTLKHINAQARAMADGQLDDPALEVPAPGALGHLLHSNVLALRHMARTLKHDADHDGLTGLLNRSGLDRQAAVTHDQDRTVLYLDLDGFKQINDTYGHEQGDDVLRAVAQRSQNVLRQNDLLARLGGDEFAIVLATTDAEYVASVIGRVLRKIAQPVRRRDRGATALPALTDGVSRTTTDSVVVGASIGQATLTAGEALDQALARADQEMYSDKRARRARARESRPVAPHA